MRKMSSMNLFHSLGGILTRVEVQWDIHVQCGGRHIHLGHMPVMCLYTSVSGHIVDCIEFI